MKTLLSSAVLLAFLITALLAACQGVKPGPKCASYHAMGADSAPAQAWFDANSEHRTMGTQTQCQFWLCEGCGKLVAIEIFEPRPAPLGDEDSWEPKGLVFFRP